MRAVYLDHLDQEEPLNGIVVGERPEPEIPLGWAKVKVVNASLNHHDLWSTRGVGVREDRLPKILGLDAAGIDEDGNDVVLHGVVSSDDWRGDETLDPRRSLLSEQYDGTFADFVVVPRRNLVPKPAELSFEEAACLGTAWLTAFRMLFSQSGLRPGGKVLVQGASGGVATSLIRLASAAGYQVFVTTRDPQNSERAYALGAHAVVASGERLSTKVDAVMETVGAATWKHSVRSLRPGGTIVICGATSGEAPANAELSTIFFQQMRVQGSTMGTRTELSQLMEFMRMHEISPLIDRVVALADIKDGMAALASGEVFGKVVVSL